MCYTSIPSTIRIYDIGNHIYTIRDKQVMLDYDLAALYGYEVRALNQQVKRNSHRFPDDFMFQLTKDEVEDCEITNCDFTKFKFLLRARRRSQKAAICLYRTGNLYAGDGIKGRCG